MAVTSILAGASGGFSILSGLFGMNAADANAASLRNQARLLQVESEADIERYASQAKTFKATQKMAYLKSGVALSGSPLDVLDETARVASENIAAMRAQTAAKGASLKSQAASMRAAGRVAFLAGVGGAMETAATTGKKLGWFTSQNRGLGGAGTGKLSPDVWKMLGQ